MKKIIALFLLALTVSACSGGSDGDDIVGSWKVKSYTLNGTTSEVLDECDSNSLFVFYSDGHFQSSGRQANQDGESCMFTFCTQWKKEADYYLVYEQNTNTIAYHAKLTKIDKNTILVEDITNNNPLLKKTLVRQ